MTDVEKSVITYGKGLTQAIKAFDVLEPEAGWLERLLIKLLRKSYRHRLRHFVGTLPSDISDEILKG